MFKIIGKWKEGLRMRSLGYTLVPEDNGLRAFVVHLFSRHDNLAREKVTDRYGRTWYRWGINPEKGG